jgi:hypothetical protein
MGKMLGPHLRPDETVHHRKEIKDEVALPPPTTLNAGR